MGAWLPLEDRSTDPRISGAGESPSPFPLSAHPPGLPSSREAKAIFLSQVFVKMLLPIFSPSLLLGVLSGGESGK